MTIPRTSIYLASGHFSLVIFMAIYISVNRSGEAVFLWIVFTFLDMPISLLIIPFQEFLSFIEFNNWYSEKVYSLIGYSEFWGRPHFIIPFSFHLVLGVYGGFMCRVLEV